MKRLFLISSFCDTEEKISVLKSNLIFLKSKGWDTLLLSPIQLDNDVISLCDYYYFTKENPVSTIEEKTYIHWRKHFTNDGKEVTMERFFPEYGWAALYQNKKLSQIGVTFEYDIYYHVIYDTKFDEKLVKEIETNKKNCYYSNKSTGGHINEFSLHYLPLDKKNMNSFESFLNKKDYNSSHDLTHDYMLKWAIQEGLPKQELIVEEYINYYTDIDFFSIYRGDELNLFFEKCEKNESVNRFFVYDVNVDNIEIVINNQHTYKNLKDKDIVNTDLYTNQIDSIKVKILDREYECFVDYNKVERNKIVID